MINLITSYALRNAGNGLRAVVEPVFISNFSGPYVAGLIIGISQILSVFSPLFIPLIARKLGLSRSAKLGTFLWGISLISASFTSSPQLYILLRLSLVLGSLLNYTLLDSIAQELLKGSARKGEIFGIISAISSISGAAGSLIASFLVGKADYASILRLSGALEIVSALFIPDINVRRVADGKINFQGAEKVIEPLAATFTVGFFWGARDIIFPLYLESSGMIALAGIIFGLSGVVAFLSQFVAGKVTDAIGAEKLIAGALAGMGLLGVIIPLFPEFLLPLSLLYVVFEASVAPAINAAFSEKLKTEERAAVNSLRTSIKAVAFSLSSVLSGFLYQKFSILSIAFFAIPHFVALYMCKIRGS